MGPGVDGLDEDDESGDGDDEVAPPVHTRMIRVDAAGATTHAGDLPGPASTLQNDRPELWSLNASSEAAAPGTPLAGSAWHFPR